MAYGIHSKSAGPRVRAFVSSDEKCELRLYRNCSGQALFQDFVAP